MISDERNSVFTFSFYYIFFFFFFTRRRYSKSDHFLATVRKLKLRNMENTIYFKSNFCVLFVFKIVFLKSTKLRQEPFTSDRVATAHESNWYVCISVVLHCSARVGYRADIAFGFSTRILARKSNKSSTRMKTRFLSTLVEAALYKGPA